MSSSNILLGSNFPSTSINLKTNLISWWDFSSNLNDSHGSNTLGTSLSSAITSFIGGLNGNAFYIDGTSTNHLQESYLYLNAPANFDALQPFTFGGWFKIIGTTGNQGIFNMLSHPLPTQVPINGTSPVLLQTYISDGFVPRPTVSIDLSTWRLLVLKYSPNTGNCTIYYPATNSISTGSVGYHNALVVNMFGFGTARGNDAGRTGDTAIDSAFVWQRELSDAEVTQLYNNGNGLTYADI